MCNVQLPVAHRSLPEIGLRIIADTFAHEGKTFVGFTVIRPPASPLGLDHRLLVSDQLINGHELRATPCERRVDDLAEEG